MAVVNKYKTLCAQPVHSSLQALAGKTHGAVPVRQQLRSGAVFTCPLTGGPSGP